MNAPARPTPTSYAMLVSLILIWGTAFLLVKIAVEAIHPNAVAAARVLFAAAIVIPFAILTKRSLPKGARRWLTCAIAGVLSLALPITLLSWAQQTVPSGVVGIYMAAIPLLVLPLAHLFSPGESMTRQKLIGFVVGFVGLLLLIGFDTVKQISSADGLAQLACLATSLCYATSSLIIRRAPKTDPIAFSAIALFVASLLVLPLGITHWPTEPIPTSIWAIMIWVGVISTGLAMVMRVTIISSVGSVFMSIAGYFLPIVALIVGATFGAEQINTDDVIACGLILGGVAYAQFGGQAAR